MSAEYVLYSYLAITFGVGCWAKIYRTWRFALICVIISVAAILVELLLGKAQPYQKGLSFLGFTIPFLAGFVFAKERVSHRANKQSEARAKPTKVEENIYTAPGYGSDFNIIG